MAQSSVRRSRQAKHALRKRPAGCPDAAGIDLGATEHFVAVPPGRAPQPVRSFTTDTAALQALADWLLQCGVRTVAMEATGVYWVPLFQVLEARGLEVCLVNARHVKNVPGRKLAVGTRPVANRLATALRMAAQSLYRTESVLGDWFRRLRAKLGTPAAITATAHKLARVLYAMVKHRQPFDPSRLGNPALRRQRKENALRRAAKELGFTLQAVAVS